MSFLQSFAQYLQEVERRMRWKAFLGGAALSLAAALAATLLLSYFANLLAFSPGSLLTARMLLFLCAGGALIFCLAVPLLRIDAHKAAKLAETNAGFNQRAMTLAGSKESNPLLELVAEEALEQARATPPEALIGRPLLVASAVAGIVIAAGLVWLTTAAPGALGYGAHLLWAGAPPAGASALYEITVKPGNASVRRGGDQLIEARVAGAGDSDVTLYARQANSTKWESVRMVHPAEGNSFVFLFAGISEGVDYRVQAGRLRSPVYTLSVVDVPGISKITTVYHYPPYLGWKDAVEDPGGDLRAVEGTEADLEAETDRPMNNGSLIFDDGSRISLEKVAGNRIRARVPIRKDGSFYFAGMENGSPVRLSGDYFVEAKPDKPPEVRLVKPPRDARVSPIEEVTVEVESSDDFGLENVELRYSVNGGPEISVPMRPRVGAKSSAGSRVIALEDHKLSPGDIVSVYALARDARSSSHTEITFLEAQPFAREYQQSQTTGGSGEGNESQADIAQRQREIISATWNQLRSAKPAGQAAEDGRFLSGVEEKLADQARSLSQRMRSRDLAGTNEEFQKFSKEMDDAAGAMKEASAGLRTQRWRDSLPAEQRALQHVLRAESLFRQIQVAFGQRGGSGGSQSQMRELENLFDLELDTEKNQYETAQMRNPANERDRAASEAIKKLEELARRQQELAQQQPQSQQAQQRWAQEMLRREAEELRKKMEQMQQMQRGSGGASAESRAQQQLEKALEDMRRAQTQPSQSQESARKAAERMSEARDVLESMQRKESGGQLDELSRSATNLSEAQRDYEKRIRQTFPDSARPGTPQISQRSATEELARQKEAMQKDWEKLERQMKDAVKSLQPTDKEAAAKVREALGEAQQNEVGLRMKLGSQWVRQGMGSYLAPREKVLTQSLDQLREQIEQARAAAQQGQQKGANREGSERALNKLESARGKLEAGKGSPSPSGYDEAARQVESLRGEDLPSELRGGVDQLAEAMRRARRSTTADPALLQGRIESDILPQLEELELKLRRSLESSGLRPGEARAAGSPQTPAGYSEAVAEYFRRLSKGNSSGKQQ